MKKDIIELLRDRATKRRADNRYSVGPDMLEEAADKLELMLEALREARIAVGSDDGETVWIATHVIEHAISVAEGKP
ncbi:hypothetical protein [Rhizobium phage RHph_X2_25]|nr:hypothetical protein [Rhizobium phage RHph_X2_25]